MSPAKAKARWWVWLCVLVVVGTLFPAQAPAAPFQGIAAIAHDTDLKPRRAWPYEPGNLSGPWTGDLQYHDGLWLMGDGFGGLWYSEDAANWKRADTRRGDRRRSMQNAPLRSITIGDNGTLLAAFLGGGGLRWPRVQRFFGVVAGQRNPLARSSDGRVWEVIETPESCGFHFAATDGAGNWMVPGCGNNILVSDDDGQSWRVRDPRLPEAVAAHGRVEAQGYINGLWVIGAGKRAEGGIFYSASKAPGSWEQALVFPPRVLPKRSLRLGEVLVMTGSWRFVATSADGRDWRIRNVDGVAAVGGSQLMQAGVYLAEDGYLLGGTHGGLMYSPDLERWYQAYPGMGAPVVGMARSPEGRIFASGSPDGLIYRIVLVRDEEHLDTLGRETEAEGFHYGELLPVLR